MIPFLIFYLNCVSSRTVIGGVGVAATVKQKMEQERPVHGDLHSAGEMIQKKIAHLEKKRATGGSIVLLEMTVPYLLVTNVSRCERTVALRTGGTNHLKRRAHQEMTEAPEMTVDQEEVTAGERNREVEMTSIGVVGLSKMTEVLVMIMILSGATMTVGH